MAFQAPGRTEGGAAVPSHRHPPSRSVSAERQRTAAGCLRSASPAREVHQEVLRLQGEQDNLAERLKVGLFCAVFSW
jgi:hypothetical protein